MSPTVEMRDYAVLSRCTCTLSQEESARWDAADGYDRREMLSTLGERFIQESAVEGECCVAFHHADGRLLGKTVYRRSFLRQTA